MVDKEVQAFLILPYHYELLQDLLKDHIFEEEAYFP
jgi:hypothetical protein